MKEHRERHGQAAVGVEHPNRGGRGHVKAAHLCRCGWEDVLSPLQDEALDFCRLGLGELGFPARLTQQCRRLWVAAGRAPEVATGRSLSGVPGRVGGGGVVLLIVSALCLCWHMPAPRFPPDRPRPGSEPGARQRRSADEVPRHNQTECGAGTLLAPAPHFCGRTLGQSASQLDEPLANPLIRVPM